MNGLMYDGKKSAAESIVYGALDALKAAGEADPLPVFHDALENVNAGAGSAFAPRRRRDLSGAGGSPHRPFAARWRSAGTLTAAQPHPADHDRPSFGREISTPPTTAATQSRSAKSHTRWPKPIAPSRIIAGDGD